MLHTVTQLLLHIHPVLIYCFVAVVLCLESSGIPLMNNTLLLFTGALAAQGQINIWLLFVAAVVGSVGGACAAYGIGAWRGRSFMMQVAKLFHIDQQRVEMIVHWCDRSGFWMVFLARVTPYVRPFGCFPAGIAGLHFPLFVLTALGGSTLWCAALLFAGWSLGRRWLQALHFMQLYTLPVLAILLAIVVLYAVAMLLLKRYLHARYTPPASDECLESARKHNDLIEV